MKLFRLRTGGASSEDASAPVGDATLTWCGTCIRSRRGTPSRTAGSTCGETQHRRVSKWLNVRCACVVSITPADGSQADGRLQAKAAEGRRAGSRSVLPELWMAGGCTPSQLGQALGFDAVGDGLRREEAASLRIALPPHAAATRFSAGPPRECESKRRSSQPAPQRNPMAPTTSSLEPLDSLLPES